MDLINEFAYIISKNKPAEFNSLIPPKSKLYNLYNLIANKKIADEDEIAHKLYKSKKDDKRYLMLKRNLVIKLSDLVFKQDYYDLEEENYKTIQFQLNKDLVIAEKLVAQNVYHYPTKIIKKIEQVAEKYYIIRSQVAAARLFRSIYSLKGFPKETTLYHKKLKALNIQLEYVVEAQGLWEVSYALTKYSIAKTQELQKKLQNNIAVINQGLENYYSPFLELYLYRMKSKMFFISNKNQEFLKSNQKLDDLLAKYPYIRSKSLTLEITYNYAVYYRNTRQLEKAKQYLDKCLSISDYRAFDRFLIQELNWDLCIKNTNYEDAIIILKEIFSVHQYQFLDPYDKSAWFIREAYLYYALFNNNKHNLIKELPSFSNGFNLKELFSRTKKSSADKYGYNINLLIIRVLLYKTSNSKEIDKEGNNLRIYFHRYLRDLNSKRTLLFFQQLVKIACSNFDKDLISDNIEPYLSEYVDNEFDTGEWIPYDVILKMVASGYK